MLRIYGIEGISAHHAKDKATEKQAVREQLLKDILNYNPSVHQYILIPQKGHPSLVFLGECLKLMILE